MNKSDLGHLEMNQNISEAMGFLCEIFDPSHGRFSWGEYLPDVFDQVWTWKLNNKIVAGLLTREFETISGARGIAIGMVGTGKEYRGKGYGSLLVKSVLDAHKAENTSFAVLWARAPLVPFYEKLGFCTVQGEDDCLLDPLEDEPQKSVRLRFEDLNSVTHIAFDNLRIKFNKNYALKFNYETVRRHFKKDKWDGISGSRGCEFGILFSGTPGLPEFYAIIGYNGRPPAIIEFIGSREQFQQTLNWVRKNLEPLPISYSLTSPHSEMLLKNVRTISRDLNFHSMVHALKSDNLKIPITTWIDRI